MGLGCLPAPKLPNLFTLFTAKIFACGGHLNSVLQDTASFGKYCQILLVQLIGINMSQVFRFIMFTKNCLICKKGKFNFASEASGPQNKK